MVARTFTLLVTFLLLLSASALSIHDRDDEGDCEKAVKLDDLSYDLLHIAHEGRQTTSRERDTSPTKMVDTISFDVCRDLKKDSAVNDKDQCGDGVRACLTKTNKKESESDRVVSVIPLATKDALNTSYSNITSGTKGFRILMHGSSYPQESGRPQIFNLTITCGDNQKPVFSDYDGSVASVEWQNKAGCGTASKDGDTPSDGGKEGDNKTGTEHVGSGIGWFFLVLLFGFTAYFGIGAYYNYSTYGARGSDLIPHRDFWREVPYMLRDVVSHLCSSVRPRSTSNRSGYIAV